MGTERLISSISQREASNAATRCGELTTTATLASPTCTAPSRCTTAPRASGARSEGGRPAARGRRVAHARVALVRDPHHAPPLVLLARRAEEQVHGATRGPGGRGEERRSEERRVGKERRSRWSPHH